MPKQQMIVGTLALLLLAISGPWLPSWLLSLLSVALAHGLAVLGMIVLWRAGLVSFGQALYYAAGGYTAALASRHLGINDAVVLVVLAALAAGLLAFLAGFLLARYRGIFFAMLSLALSMILYGVLINSATLGASDGLAVPRPTFFGLSPGRSEHNLALFFLVIAFVGVAAFAVERYNTTIAGALSIPIMDNELRIEFLGLSVNRLVHLKVVLAGFLSGAGGGIVALSIAHVDPTMAFWTTSGAIVFVAILAGTASVWGAFVGALLFEFIRTIAVATVPGTWQLILGAALLLTIMFVPQGVGGLLFRRHKLTGPEQ